MQATPMDSTRERTRVELKNAELDKFSLGTKVRVVMEGTVAELRAPEKWTRYCDGEEKEEITPACMYVVVDSKKVTPTGNAQIDEIVATDEAEDEMPC